MAKVVLLFFISKGFDKILGKFNIIKVIVIRVDEFLFIKFG